MKNSYEREAAKQDILDGITKDLETKHNAKNSAIETLKDVVIGVVAGGVTGSAIGRASLIVGAAVTGLGHYYKSRLATIFGIGMMAANGYQGKEGQVKGVEGTMEGLKERVLNFKDSFQQKLFLDKLKSKKEQKKDGTAGMGEVQYFSYPPNKELEGKPGELDMTALDRLEKQVEESANAYEKKNKEVSGSSAADDLDISERNF